MVHVHVHVVITFFSKLLTLRKLRPTFLFFKHTNQSVSLHTCSVHVNVLSGILEKQVQNRYAKTCKFDVFKYNLCKVFSLLDIEALHLHCLYCQTVSLYHLHDLKLPVLCTCELRSS